MDTHTKERDEVKLVLPCFHIGLFSCWVAYHATPDSCQASTLYLAMLMYRKVLITKVFTEMKLHTIEFSMNNPQKAIEYPGTVLFIKNLPY